MGMCLDCGRKQGELTDDVKTEGREFEILNDKKNRKYIEHITNWNMTVQKISATTKDSFTFTSWMCSCNKCKLKGVITKNHGLIVKQFN